MDYHVLLITAVMIDLDIVCGFAGVVKIKDVQSEKKLEPVVSYGYGDKIYSIAVDVVGPEGYVWARYVARNGATRYVAIGIANGSEKYLVKV